MEVLNRPTKSYKIPNYCEEFIGANSLSDSFIVVYQDFHSIHEGSIVVQDIDKISEDNQTAIGQIRGFKFLSNNWDEEGAKEIPEAVVSRALQLVKQINRFGFDVYLASPGPNQEILLMLKSGIKEIELLIYPDREKFVKFEGTEFVEQGNFLGKELSALLEWLA